METKQALSSRTEGAQAPPGDPAAIPVPLPARAAIAEYQRQLAAANAALQAYLAGLAAGLEIPADRIEQVDLETWTIRLRTDQPESAAGRDGRGPAGMAAAAT